jgi:hypothetical protein
VFRCDRDRYALDNGVSKTKSPRFRQTSLDDLPTHQVGRWFQFFGVAVRADPGALRLQRPRVGPLLTRQRQRCRNTQTVYLRTI